jgi:hypothetical protein
MNVFKYIRLSKHDLNNTFKDWEVISEYSTGNPMYLMNWLKSQNLCNDTTIIEKLNFLNREGSPISYLRKSIDYNDIFLIEFKMKSVKVDTSCFIDDHNYDIDKKIDISINYNITPENIKGIQSVYCDTTYDYKRDYTWYECCKYKEETPIHKIRNLYEEDWCKRYLLHIGNKHNPNYDHSKNIIENIIIDIKKKFDWKRCIDTPKRIPDLIERIYYDEDTDIGYRLNNKKFEDHVQMYIDIKKHIDNYSKVMEELYLLL